MRTSSLRLLPAIARIAPQRAEQLRLKFSAYVAILLRNQEAQPVKLEAEPDSARLARVPVPCSWAAGLGELADELAESAGLTRNALVEALIARDLRSAEMGLRILPQRGVPKPRL